GGIGVSVRGVLGADFAAASNDGKLAQSSYRFCGAGINQVLCPLNAVFRKRVASNDGALSFAYYDKLGRELMVVTQSFNIGVTDRDLSAVCTHYDRYGRAVEKTEPFFLTGIAVTSADVVHLILRWRLTALPAPKRALQ
ncbi:hypothetical protein HC761_00400, partial [bacterium]|nr:hypothetical protein [bacterium]